MSQFKQYRSLVTGDVVRAARIHSVDAEGGTLALFDPLGGEASELVPVPSRSFVFRLGHHVPEPGGYAVESGGGLMFCPGDRFEAAHVLRQEA